MERPQSSVGDFYREMGALFGVNLSPANRYGGFKALRERWGAHIKTTLMRSLLLIDQALEMVAACLNELRLLSSADFDSQSLLTVVLSGDMRLPERFRSTTLVSLGTRLRVRLNLEPLTKDQLLDYIEHTLSEAGAPHLMSDPLRRTLADHTSGNLRLLNSIAEKLLVAAVARELPQLDEKLFIETFSRRAPQPRQPQHCVFSDQPCVRAPQAAIGKRFLNAHLILTGDLHHTTAMECQPVAWMRRASRKGLRASFMASSTASRVFPKSAKYALK